MTKSEPVKRARKKVTPAQPKEESNTPVATNVAAVEVAPKEKSKRSNSATPSIEGLKKPQVRILLALMDDSSLTRSEIAEKANVDNASLTGYLGSTDPAVRAKNDESWHPSLITMKLIKFKIVDEGGKDVPRYEIMALGKRKAEKALKEIESRS